MDKLDTSVRTEWEPGLRSPLFAKFANGDWFAVPVTMVESFRKAGMEIRSVEELPEPYSQK